MSLLTLIVALVALGVLLYLINSFVPMEPSIKRILNIAVIVLVLLWLLTRTGFLAPLADVRV